jgi:3-oxoacyl-[acyl-carrier-protein] synthase II
LHRAVITVVDVVSPIGTTKDVFWENLSRGENAISLVENLDASTDPCRIAGGIKGFDPTLVMEKREDNKSKPLHST